MARVGIDPQTEPPGTRVEPSQIGTPQMVMA